MGLMFISLKIARGEPLNNFDLFAKWRKIGWFILLAIIMQVCVLAGMALLIVPGIILACSWFLAPWYIVDQDMKPVQAIKASMAATHGSKAQIFVFGLVSFCIVLVGVCGTCCFGYFVLIPMLFIAKAHIYLALTGEAVVSSKTDKETGDDVYAESPA